jgi:hypothetical protein
LGYSLKGEAKSPQAHYATMDVAGLVRLLKPMLAVIMTERCTTCLRVYGTRLPDTLRVVLSETGSVYQGELLTWRKPGAFGLGKATRKRFENIGDDTARRGELPIRAHDIDQECSAKTICRSSSSSRRRGAVIQSSRMRLTKPWSGSITISAVSTCSLACVGGRDRRIGICGKRVRDEAQTDPVISHD